MVKILFVGQTPPPYGGQAIMQQLLLDGHYDNIHFIPVRMAFSHQINEVGKFRGRKLLHLLSIIIRIISLRIRHNIKLLYYPPAGPNRIPMYRDIAILLLTRHLFKQTIFHFHAAGISELYSRLSPLEQLLFRKAYFKPDLAIALSDLNPPDAETLRARKIQIIPNGIKDQCPLWNEHQREETSPPTLLFVGIICEAKGVLIFLDACRRLKKESIAFKAKFMGEFESEDFKRSLINYVETHQLKESVEFLGPLIGDAKWAVYRKSSIFVFPSFYHSESLGVVLIEAMQFALPVVSTMWRGISSVVEDGGSGFLVPIKDSWSLADKIAQLLADKDLRRHMGRRGREIYLERFTIERFRQRIEAAILSLNE